MIEKKKSPLRTILVLIILSVLCSLIYVFYVIQDGLIKIKCSMNTSNFGDIHSAFMDYRYKDGIRDWPRTFEEAGISQISTKDVFTGLPYECLTSKNYYHFYNHSTARVLVCLPRPFRDHIWPFGTYKVLVLDETGNIMAIPLANLHELEHSPQSSVGQSNFEKEGRFQLFNTE